MWAFAWVFVATGWFMPALAAERAPQSFTILIAGDTGFNASLAPVDDAVGYKHGEPIRFGTALQGVSKLPKADLGFFNLETVVTDRNDIAADLKAFNFRTHPNAIREIVQLGFQIVSTANNHSMDYGIEGAAETLKHLARMRGHGLLAWPGLGATRAEALRAHLVEWKGARFGFVDPEDVRLVPANWRSHASQWVDDLNTERPYRIAVSAIGILGGAAPAGEARAGQLSYSSREDFAAVLNGLVQPEADYRILSVHYGREFNVFTSEDDIARLRRQAASGSGIDLVIGHHQHVVAGVETVKGGAIFYGLGNFIHFGTRDLSNNGVCRDYGLVARVHVTVGEGRRSRLAAIEAIPVKGTHRHVQPIGGAEGQARIAVLNWLANRLDNEREGARGVRFLPRTDGTGLYCAPGAAQWGGASVAALCQTYTEPPVLRERDAYAIADACGARLVSEWEE